jgi:pimeloyl-ACP methyl ester carboxylesterase
VIKHMKHKQMKNTSLNLLFLLITQFALGQTREKIMVQATDPYELYYTNDKDSTNLFYIKYAPKSVPKGVIVILPGGGETVEMVEKQVRLHKMATQKNYLVVIPSINWGTNKYYPEYKFLDTIFTQLIKQYKVSKKDFILGGYSGGAMLSLSYAIRANKYVDSTLIKRKAVFGVDPPVDFAHLWKHCENDIARNFSESAVNEGKWIMDSYTQDFGGSPEMFPQEYINYSIYSHSEKDGGNAKYLLSTPLLLYTEPGIEWQMKNRRRDVYDLNCSDISAMINLLNLKGHPDANLVITNNKGRRLDGKAHPHSWSIMDNNQVLDWIEKIFNKKS